MKHTKDSRVLGHAGRTCDSCGLEEVVYKGKSKASRVDKCLTCLVAVFPNVEIHMPLTAFTDRVQDLIDSQLRRDGILLEAFDTAKGVRF